VELLEARNLLSFTNVLVNNPAEDNGIFNGKSGLDTESETAIVLGAKSNVVVAFNDDGQFAFPNPVNPTFTGYSLSTKSGASFTDKGSLPGNTPYWPGGDPVLARSSKTGTLFLANNTFNTDQLATTQGSGERIGIFRSVDNGVSFASPMLNASPGFVAGVDVADKPWIVVDNHPGPGYGNVYLAWTDQTVKSDGSLVDKGIYFTRSTDDGLTWGPSGGVPIDVKPGTNNVQGAFVTVGPDHTVYVIWWFGATSQNILLSKSTDLGQTFSDPVIVTRLNTNGSGIGDLGLTYSNTNSSSFRAFVLPQAAVNPVTGDIYVVYNDQPKGNPKDKADIFFTMSSDGGNTWSSPLRVNDDLTTTDQWQPAIAVTPDGSHVGIFWYDRRNDPTNDSLIDRYGVIATVSGHSLSFAPNFRISNVSFPPAFAQDPFVHPDYMGDYDMATADNNYFYTSWGDNRLSDAFYANQPDVRFALIPVTGGNPPAVTYSGSTTASPATAGGTGSDTGALGAGGTQAGLPTTRGADTAADPASLDPLSLLPQAGANFDPKSAAPVQAWPSVPPTVSRYGTLAMQLAVLDLNVQAGSADLDFAGGLLPYARADHIAGLTGGGFIDVQDLMQAANAVLNQVRPRDSGRALRR
jgi:hypothetical protein